MKYKANSRRRAVEYEKDLIQYWKKHKTFEKSVEQRPADNTFVFYDGPPFLTGTPHHGHLLISAAKDAVARFWTMKGYRVERRWGWDCHGLPAEVYVEKSLGIANKKEIGTKISITEYVNACRAAMVKTGTEWEDAIERIGRWVEFKGAYKTMDNEFMESVWWAFKRLYDDGKIYDGEKILIYCTKDATPISKSEVAMENSYKKVTDPSLYTLFQIEDRNEYLLAWTTTPWTLPANVALAVNPSIEYTLVEHEGKKMYVASSALSRVFTNEKHQPLAYTIIDTVKGTSLVGKKYHPLFENRGPNAHVVLAAEFVTADDGTGIVHQAPAYGEDDYVLCKQHNIPTVSVVDENGNYTEGRWIEKNIWDVNKEIAKTLLAEGKALKIEYIEHDYPHCHRCGSKLMYRAHPSWFMDIQGQKEDMQQANKEARWVPKALQVKRFANIINTAPDWNLSRDRYWATPIPVWKGYRQDGTEVIKVIGSYEEFMQLTGKTLHDYHLPNVMDITFTVDGVELHHIGKVLDCWFESGSMPFAQFHYPFENKVLFERSYPADFIIEAIDQTRGWFYSLTAVNVALFGHNPFKNLICTGFINAADGKKMSKKLKNYTDPIELMDKTSADSFRFLLLGSPLLNGENFALSDKDVIDVARKLSMIWNMYDFFTMYADVDGWEWDGSLIDPGPHVSNVLDKWIISRVHQLVKEVENNMESYDMPNALKPVLPFVDDASNWYVRRSRRRFWKSGDDKDKQEAYRTLHYVLVRLSMVLAPFTPFLSEELYRNLTGDESVHLLDWPTAGHINDAVIEEMAAVRDLINQGLGQRAQAGIKIRQPLRFAEVTGDNVNAINRYDDILAEELNVKHILIQQASHFDNNGVPTLTLTLDMTIDDELRREGMSRELIRYIQNLRKTAGLHIDDRIHISVQSASTDILQTMDEFRHNIMQETLSLQEKAVELQHAQTIEIDGMDVTISLEKA